MFKKPLLSLKKGAFVIKYYYIFNEILSDGGILMSAQTYMNIGLLFWSCVFCFIAAICILASRNYNKEKRIRMVLMELSAALLLLADVFAWWFRGEAGYTAGYAVRVSNFLVFFLTDVILFLFNGYLGCSVLNSQQMKNNKRIKIVYVIAEIGACLVIVSQYTDLYYYFDKNNLYHRNNAYIIALIIPAIGMLIDLSLLIEKRKSISRKMFISMASYVFLPILAAVIQSVHYGMSLINVAIGGSMMIMFLTVTVEQDSELGQLARSEKEAAERLEISTTLNNCIAVLTLDKEIDVAIYNLLGIINDYFKSDRTYIFDINYEKKIISNIYEYANEDITKEKDNLQEVPISIISEWLDNFKKYNRFCIEDVNAVTNRETYEILSTQNIQRLLAVPLMKEREIVGFLGVDNPTNHYDDETLLQSIQFFVTNSLLKKEEQEYLRYLSYADMLTKLYNRNKYIEVIDNFDNEHTKDIGIAYIDLNGLKKINDEQGHEAGDQLIINAANVLKDVFPNQSYRIGGDEFVVISTGIKREDFNQKIKDLKIKMKQNNVSVSTGTVWKSRIEDIEQVLKEADKYMYVEKDKYHKMTGGNVL